MKLLSTPQKCVPALVVGDRVYRPEASYIMATSMHEIAVIVGAFVVDIAVQEFVVGL